MGALQEPEARKADRSPEPLHGIAFKICCGQAFAGNSRDQRVPTQPMHSRGRCSGLRYGGAPNPYAGTDGSSGKMGKYHDGKENGTYQLQAGQCLFSLASAIAEAHKARRTTMPMINKLPFMGRLLGIQA